MKNFTQVILLSVCLVLLTIRCNEYDFSPREYPRIKTLPVTEVSNSEATFHAEFIYRGDFEVIEYGFVWDNTGDLKTQYENKITFSDNIKNDRYTAKVSDTFTPGNRYYVKAYIQTNEHLVFGQPVEFRNL